MPFGSTNESQTHLLKAMSDERYSATNSSNTTTATTTTAATTTNSSNSNDAKATSGGITRSRRLFVGNLSFSTTWQNLKDHFQGHGNVTYARILMDSAIGRSRGYGVVEFETVEQAQAAMDAMNGTELHDRKIFMREDRSDKELINKDFVPMERSGGGRGEGGYGGRGRGYSSFSGRDHAHYDRYSNSSMRSHPYLSDYGRVGGMLYDGNTGSSSSSGYGAGYGSGYAGGYGNHNSSGGGATSSTSAGGSSSGSGGGGSGGYPTMLPGDYGILPPTMPPINPQYLAMLAATQMPQPMTLFVGNLPFKMRWSELKNMFQRFGNVLRADIMLDDHGRPKGCGLVQMASIADAHSAIDNLNNCLIDGRRLEVRYHVL